VPSSTRPFVLVYAIEWQFGVTTEEIARTQVMGLCVSREAMPGGGPESLHVLRYSARGEYVLHYDASWNEPMLPRVLTLLHYLEDGGSTWFPHAGLAAPPDVSRQEALAMADSLSPELDGLTVSPSKGDTILFYHFDTEGELDSLAIHAGLPVVHPAGTKLIASHFIRVPAQAPE